MTMITVLLLPACATHRQRANMHWEKTCLHDSIEIHETAYGLELRSSNLSAYADSVAWDFEADSLVTQAGDRIFRPRLRKTAHAPAVSRLDSCSAQNVRIMDNAQSRAMDAEASSQTDTLIKTKATRFPALAIVATTLILVAALIIWKRKSPGA